MKILILGAGQVGGTLAESLAQEAFDITLVDVDGARLQELGMRLDIQTIEGSASHPDVLRHPSPRPLPPAGRTEPMVTLELIIY